MMIFLKYMDGLSRYTGKISKERKTSTNKSAFTPTLRDKGHIFSVQMNSKANISSAPCHQNPVSLLNLESS